MQSRIYLLKSCHSQIRDQNKGKIMGKYYTRVASSKLFLTIEMG